MSDRLGRVYMRREGDESGVIQKFTDSYGNTCVIHGFDCSGHLILETHSSVDPNTGHELDEAFSSFVAISPEMGLKLMEMFMQKLSFRKVSF